MKRTLLIGGLLAGIGIGANAQTYAGFDKNEYPGDASLTALHQTFAFAGFWLNTPPGAKKNTWAGKRAVVEKAGFGFLVLYTGKTFAQLKGSEAEEVGAADGQAAVAAAQQAGFPTGTVIFLDQEEGGRLLPEQKDYLFAWIDAVNASHYRAGVYCSGIPFTESSGETVVTAEDIRKNAGDRKISYFVANDQCPPSPGCAVPKTPPKPSESGVDFADVWQYAQTPRRPELTQSCANTYAPDGNCYAPSTNPSIFIDVATGISADPSRGRTAK